MFDTGANVRARQLEQALTACGIEHGPALLFLTHAHADHSGGAAFLKTRYGCQVAAGLQTAEWLDKPTDKAISLDVAKRVGLYPEDYAVHRCAVDRLIDDGTTMVFGGASIKAIATPGHSADHFSYLVQCAGKTTLIAGDALFANGTVLLQDTWDCSVSQSCASIKRLSDFSFDMLLPGHGPILASDGSAAVQTALARIERALPLLNLV